MQAFGKEAPRQLRTDGEKKIEAAASERLAGASVLLVEDNEINQQVAMEILSGAGLKVTVANNGQEALDLVRANAFDAVLMDVQMPVMDGYTATRKFGEREAGSGKGEGGISRPSLKARASSLPIIAMTAHAMAGDHEKSIAAGMNDHVTKPIDPVQLFGTLAKWIGPREGAQKPAEAAPAPTGPQAKEPPPPEQTLPEALPEFDLAEGLQRLMGNRALYRKLLVNFATQYANAAADIRSALDAADFDHAHGLVHAIKGVAGNLAAKDLQAQSVPLEKLVKHADPANPPPAGEVNPAYQAFREALGRALEAVRSLMPAAVTPAASAETSCRGPSTAGWRRRQPLACGRRPSWGMSPGLRPSAVSSPPNPRLSPPYAARVARLADDFDFDGVLKLTEALEKQ